MKRRGQKQSGGVLLVALVAAGVMGVALASYLGLVRSQNISTMRSQQWNQALPIAEAGVEESLVHLSNVSTNDRATNGWTLVDDAFTKERWIGSNKYIAKISKATSPSITVEGFVPDQSGKGFMSSPRTVRVTTTNDALFAKGMVARGVIDLRGNNIKTDSFDSTDTTASTGGLYDPAKSRDRGDVATNSGLINSLSIGNADIYGRASTGPGGSISVGSSGGVGSKAWHAAGNHGVQAGWTSDDMNVAFPDVKAPFTTGSTPNSGTVGGTAYRYVLGTGNYDLSNLTMSGNQEMIVTGDAILYVRDGIAITGNAQIIIAPGGSLKIYMAGPNASIGGNGVANQSGSAMNFAYFGLPTNTGLSFGGNAAFTGMVYAPSANFTLGGGGSDRYDFVGASVTSTVMMNGHFNFHYDEALGKIGPRRGYVVTSWNEI